MFKAIFQASIASLLFVSYYYTVQIADAQVAPTNSATISGDVSDSSGKPVPSAKVTLAGPKSASTQTDAQGLFVFIGVPFGTYSISAAAVGLGTVTRSTIIVQGDTNVAIQYELSGVNGLKVIANVSSSANATFNVTPASIRLRMLSKERLHGGRFSSKFPALRKLVCIMEQIRSLRCRTHRLCPYKYRSMVHFLMKLRRL